MQYKNYTIQIVESGCIVRDSKGKIIVKTETEEEAKKFVDELTKQ